MSNATRETSVAGQFYPGSSEEIESMIAHFNSVLENAVEDRELFELAPRAVIVPHAGYIYSGFTANTVLRLLPNAKPKRIVVIGPSHRAYLAGVSISDFDKYDTPLGRLAIDTELVSDLKEKFGLQCLPEAHHEHSTEVQMPFIEHYVHDAKVVELVYGDELPQHLSEIIDYLLNDPDTLVVISTDLSHYHDIEMANRLDGLCLEAVSELDTTKLHKGCEACGKIGIEALIMSALNRNLAPVVLDYRTSADASNDTSQVVGYMSALFLENE